MPYVAVPSFLTALRRKPSFGRLALDLPILTGARSQEVRLATWSEFDLEGRIWTIPLEHMQRGKAHMVPLSEAALAVIDHRKRSFVKCLSMLGRLVTAGYDIQRSDRAQSFSGFPCQKKRRPSVRKGRRRGTVRKEV